MRRPAPGLRLQISGQVEGMAGPATGGDPQAEAGASGSLGRQPGPQLGEHGPVPARPAAVVAPAQPEGSPRLGDDPSPQPGVGGGTHWIGGPAQRRRRRRDAGEQVEHLEGTVAPAPGEALQPPEGGIVAQPIGPGGVEADEDQPRPLGCPHPFQPPAVATAGAEGGLGAMGLGAMGGQAWGGGTDGDGCGWRGMGCGAWVFGEWVAGEAMEPLRR